jgi:transposase
MARNGLIEKDIAEQIGISLRTLTYWKKKYPEILRALKEGNSTRILSWKMACIKPPVDSSTQRLKSISN